MKYTSLICTLCALSLTGSLAGEEDAQDQAEQFENEPTGEQESQKSEAQIKAQNDEEEAKGRAQTFSNEPTGEQESQENEAQGRMDTFESEPQGEQRGQVESFHEENSGGGAGGRNK